MWPFTRSRNWAVLGPGASTVRNGSACTRSLHGTGTSSIILPSASRCCSWYLARPHRVTKDAPGFDPWSASSLQRFQSAPTTSGTPALINAATNRLQQDLTTCSPVNFVIENPVVVLVLSVIFRAQCRKGCYRSFARCQNRAHQQSSVPSPRPGR